MEENVTSLAGHTDLSFRWCKSTWLHWNEWSITLMYTRCGFPPSCSWEYVVLKMRPCFSYKILSGLVGLKLQDALVTIGIFHSPRPHLKSRCLVNSSSGLAHENRVQWGKRSSAYLYIGVTCMKQWSAGRLSDILGLLVVSLPAKIWKLGWEFVFYSNEVQSAHVSCCFACTCFKVNI